MSGRIDSAIRELQTMDRLAKQDRWLNRVHPLGKLLLTVLFVTLTVSFPKYDLAGLLNMMLYPLILFLIGEVSFREALFRLRVVLPVVCIVGVFNPFFDRAVIGTIGSFPVTGGVVSMLTLMLKAVLTVLASYLLIATTPIESICYALRLLHLPKGFVVQILLIYRYISVLLREAHRVTTAYRLRAPGQKGITFAAWGPLVGQMLLRSMDRADVLYQSMQLRGFSGEFYPAGKRRFLASDLCFLLIGAAALILLRLFPVLAFIGGIFL